MIIRAILENPELAENFDYFNDYQDTKLWLCNVKCDEFRRTRAINALKDGYNKFRNFDPNEELCDE